MNTRPLPGLARTAAAAALAAGLLAGAPTASAAAPAGEVRLQTSTSVTVFPVGEVGDDTSSAFTVSLVGDTGTSGRPGLVTVDTSGLSHVAKVGWPDGCQVTGAVGTCTVPVLAADAVYSPSSYLFLRLRGADDGAPGASGSIKVTGTVDGRPVRDSPGTSTVSVGTYSQLMTRTLAPEQALRPGDKVDSRFVLWNRTGAEIKGVETELATTVGLKTVSSLPKNCSADTLAGHHVYYHCSFPDAVLAPGQAYTLSEPLAVVAGATGMHESLHTKAYAGAKLPAAGGTAPAVQLVKDSDHPVPTDLGRSRPASTVEVRNHTDLQVTGSRVQGPVGSTVDATVTVTNSGPAWINNGPGADGTYLPPLTVTVPDGTTAVAIPDRCVRTDAPYGADRTGGRTYECYWPTYLLFPGVKNSLSFRLRIDRPVTNSLGTATLPTNARNYLPLSYFGDDPSNDSAVVSVSSGQNPSASPTPAPTGSPKPPATAPAGSPTGGGGTTTSTRPATATTPRTPAGPGTTSPAGTSLAFTGGGSGMGTTAAVGVGVTALGGLLAFWAARRRRGAHR
ncbi:hypothetical protein ABT095_28335 [Kitasatospora sp. NPDC002227]|uniref:hypothetical protein n=1 Tax=Kitasatospora sp. NPDC002227 TaxID=3154773 RepID=UPI003328CEE3